MVKTMNKLLAVSIFAAATAASMHAQAFKFDDTGDWDVRWDNTFRGNVMLRVEDQDPSIYDPNRANPSAAARLSDDADYSVKQGHFASQRIDLLSEIDVVWKDSYGFRVSGAGWYDFAYNNSAYPKSGATKGFPSVYSTFSPLTVQPGDYTDKAEDLHYRGGELLDAFVFGNFEVKDASVNVRAGRHTIYWGNSVFPTGTLHGFAGSMAALDLAKGLGTPGIESKELYIPNNKISSTVQFNDKVTLSGYYALEFVPLRWPEAGTYFSLNELLTENSECLTAVALPNGRQCLRAVDYKSKSSGDWGLNLGYYFEPWDVATNLIYMNATDRVTSGLYSVFDGATEAETNQAKETKATQIGHYGWVYKDDIDVFGIALAKEFWDISWGMDIVYRNNAALSPDLNNSLFAPYSGVSDVDPGSNYPGPTGDTVHIVTNAVGFLSPDWGLWEGGTYVAELVLSELLSFGEFENKANTFIKEHRVCSTFGGLFKPTWFQVRSGWDLSAPASISYAMSCKQAPISAGGSEKIGSGSVGLELDIEQAWLLALKYNVYFGPQENGTSAFIKDRDNIALTVKRTF
jgi:hypothetical protein